MSGALAAKGAEPEADPAAVPCLRWVAAYLATLTWGGSEEGGWLYSTGELVAERVRAVEARAANAKEAATKLREPAPDTAADTPKPSSSPRR